jgi:hypothetical protein
VQNGSTNVEEYLKKLPNWQASNLKLFRDLVREFYPGIKEEIKWGVPVFILNNKMLFAMAAFKEHTKYNFIQNGALLADKDKLFNNGFESKKSRGIDLKQSEKIDEEKLRKLIKDAGSLAST